MFDVHKGLTRRDSENPTQQSSLFTFYLQHKVQFSDVIWKHRSLQIKLLDGKLCRTHCLNFPWGRES